MDSQGAEGQALEEGGSVQFKLSVIWVKHIQRRHCVSQASDAVFRLLLGLPGILWDHACSLSPPSTAELVLGTEGEEAEVCLLASLPSELVRVLLL